MTHEAPNNAHLIHKGSNKSTKNAQNDDESPRGNRESQDNLIPNHLQDLQMQRKVH